MDSSATFQQLTAALWRGGEHCYYWTPDGREYTDSDGNTQREKITAWAHTDSHPQPPAPWLAGKNVYFGVNPTAEIPTTNSEGKPRKPQHLRARNNIIAALNCYYTELDGKDYVTKAEFLPFYVAPELDGLTKAKARGALQRAQTAAIDAAYKASPAEYKRRAYEHMISAPLRASMAWDSGGGYQAVWLFADTVPVTDANRDALRHDQRAWVHLLGGDGSACDLARVLRVPGSVNYKPKYAPNFPEVAILWAELDRRYSLADFRALLPPMEETPKVERRRVHVPAGAPAELGEFGDVPRLPRHGAIDAYNASTDLHTLLLELGYTDAGSGRMNRPGGSTAGVQLHANNTASIFSSADPLFCEHRITPAHALCVYEHDGDPAAMLAALPVPNGPLIAQVRAWLHSIDLSQHVPIEKQCANGYRTRERDLAVADAILDAFFKYGKCSGPLGLRQLKRMVNAGGLDTVRRTLDCLTPWFIQPAQLDGDDVEKDPANGYELAPAVVEMAADLVRKRDTIAFCNDKEEGVPFTHTTFSAYRARDAFNATTTPITPAMIEERAAAGCPYSTAYTLTAVYRRLMAAALPGAGRTALVIVDALVNAGGGVQFADLVGLGGRSRFTIGRAVGRLADLHLVEVDGGAVTLRPDWQDWLENIGELMPTHGNGRRRMVRDAVAALEGCQRRAEQAKESGVAAPDWCTRRRERAERELKRLAPALWRREFAAPADAVELGHRRMRQNKPTSWDILHGLMGKELLTPVEYAQSIDLSARLGASATVADWAVGVDIVGAYTEAHP